jgi:Tol biopolymer transport system component
VPNTQPYDVGYPKWSRREIGDWFILFSHPASSIGSAIYRINPDGSGFTRITNPGPNQKDEFPDSVRDQYVVFDRYDSISEDRDLYLKPLSGTGSELRLTNTPDQSEERPVVSNDGQLLAYRVWSNQGKEQIHVARFVTKIEIAVEKIIDLTPPAQINIHGIHFSPDDRELVISAEVSDVPSN